MGKLSRRKQERFTPVEIKIIHTDQRVHLKEGQHVVTVMFDFNPDKHDPEPWAKMTRLAPIDFIGTPDSVAVQIYSMMEIIHGAIHCHTGLSGFQKTLADLEVTSKAVERIAESIGEDIAAREQQQIQRAVQLDLPMVVGKTVPILYVLMDGTGVPVVKKETEGRAGKTAGEPAHTREAKLGCVFTQTKWDAEGYPIRDPGSTTYTGAIETAEQFGKRLYLEAWNRDWSRAEKKVVIGDGAEWIWNIAQQHFPGALQIVDLFHARQHVWDLARKLFPLDKAERERWITIEQHHLDEGKIEELVCSLRSIQVADPDLAEEILTQSEYFDKNAERMRYPKFREQHLFVGSGVIEAGCKTVIGARLKQSGMFWTVRGANAILALRCCQMNGEFEDYWESRAA